MEEPAHRNNHLYMDIKGIPQKIYPEAFIEHIKDRVYHAGFRIISNTLFLINYIKKNIINLHNRDNIGIHRPKNPDITRFKKSDGHRISY